MSRAPRTCVRGCGRDRIPGSRVGLCLECLTGRPPVAPPAVDVPLPFELDRDRPRHVHASAKSVDTGRRLRDEGTQTVADVVDLEWRACATATLERLAATGKPFTADDVTREAGVPARVNAVGALFLGASRRGLIRRTGSTSTGSARAAQHARALSVWRGAEADA